MITVAVTVTVLSGYMVLLVRAGYTALAPREHAYYWSTMVERLQTSAETAPKIGIARPCRQPIPRTCPVLQSLRSRAHVKLG